MLKFETSNRVKAELKRIIEKLYDEALQLGDGRFQIVEAIFIENVTNQVVSWSHG